jgi:hypothetical protein
MRIVELESFGIGMLQFMSVGIDKTYISCSIFLFVLKLSPLQNMKGCQKKLYCQSGDLVHLIIISERNYEKGAIDILASCWINSIVNGHGFIEG